MSTSRSRQAPPRTADLRALAGGMSCGLHRPRHRRARDRRRATDGPSFRLLGHRVVLDDTHFALRDRLLARLDADAYNPPDLDARTVGAGTALLRALEADGGIVRLTDRVAYSARAMEAAIAELRRLYELKGACTTSKARARLGSTRKYVVPLLEELDRRGVTRRVGDQREVR